MIGKLKNTLRSEWGLPIAGFCFLTGAVLTWRKLISPFMTRRDRDRAEAYANILISERQKKLTDNS